MGFEKKHILALMSALIYGQSKTLRVPECVALAEEIWGEIERVYPSYMKLDKPEPEE